MTALSATCPLCTGEGAPFARGEVLGHRAVQYLRCSVCRSVYLPEPDWLAEAYSDAITPLDVGLLGRCVQLANITGALMATQGLGERPCLDFAGGYGTLTRLMRDRGRDFHHDDPYCQNVFARGFEGSLDRRYALVTAFEVLEHLTAPRRELANVADTTDLMLFTTQLLPEPAPRPGAWDYYAPESGQHVTFATLAGLRALGGALGYRLTSSGRLVHLFHRRPIRPATRLLLRDERLAYALGLIEGELRRRRALTVADSRAAAQSLNTSRRDPAVGD